MCQLVKIRRNTKQWLYLLPISLFITSCQNKVKSTNNNMNDTLPLSACTVTIHYKGAFKKILTKINCYDKYNLSENLIITPPAYNIDTSHPNTIIYNFLLKSPTFVFIGLNELYMQPNDSIDLTVLRMKNNVIPIFRINSGTTFITNPTGRTIFNTIVDSIFTKAMKHNKPDYYYSVDFAKNAGTKMFEIISNLYPIIQQDSLSKNFIYSLCRDNFMQILANGNLREIPDSILSFFITYSKINKKLAYRSYWNIYKHISQIYVTRIEDKNFDYNFMNNLFKSYSDTIRQFFFMQYLKNYSYIIKKDTNNYKTIKNSITYSPFIHYLKDYEPAILPTSKNGMPSNIQNTIVYNYKNQKIKFANLFQTTRTPLIIFDFCGTWCQPCMNEIEKYSKKMTLDTSQVIRPIWIFFENDSSTWKRVIDRFQLKKENCFLMLDPNFIQKFGQKYNWQATFPHYVIFRKDGSIINSNAPSFNNYADNNNKIKQLE